MTRIVLTTGGTGGHIFPALAVAEALRAACPDVALLFIGGAGPEGGLATKAGLSFVGLPAHGVFGRGLRALAAPVWMARAFGMAFGVLRDWRPGVVAGFGGYAGFVPVAAAKLMGLPTAIHEQNSVPGVTNKILGRFVDRVFITYPDEGRAFPAQKTRLLGNPIRGGIAAATAASPREPGGRNLLVLGGSQGARAINDAVIDILPRLLAAGVTVRLQAGRADFERVKARVAETLAGAPQAAGQGGVVIENFIEDMAEAYAWADLVLCRAGAMTLAELWTVGLGAVLVPFPFAVDDHQSHNARYAAERGAAIVVPQPELSAERLARLLGELAGDRGRVLALARAARALAVPDAAERVARACLEVCDG